MKRFTFLFSALLALVLVCSSKAPTTTFARDTAPPEPFGENNPSTRPPFAQGISAVSADTVNAQSMGYDWIKLYSPPENQLPMKVLLRVDVTALDYDNLGEFSNSMYQLVAAHGDKIDAYEIGNEVNMLLEWLAPPDASRYAEVLCTAQQIIETWDPTAVTISAGLAPVGRIEGNYGGHPGHNGDVQDEREFLPEFIAAGGHLCADAIGYHPMGFSADFDAEPDVDGGTPETYCDQGFCFRSAEKIHEILVAHGLNDMPIWATEVGWITEPPAYCLTTPSWEGRAWQIVTPEKQAENITGAFTYAQLYWPWMEGLFIFNLNFDEATWYDNCEQMRYYSVDGPILPVISDRFLPVIFK